MNPPEHHPRDARTHADHADQLLDANLRMLGEEVGAQADMPSLTPELLASFKSGARTADDSSHERDIVAMIGERSDGHRVWISKRRLTAGLSAAAAAVAVAAVVFTTHTPMSTVNAAAILSSLRARTISGVNITFNDLRTPDAAIDGTINVRLDPALDINTILDAGFEPQGTHGQGLRTGSNRSVAAATLNIAAFAPGIEGMQFRVDMGFHQDKKWVYVQNTHVPEKTNRSDASGLALASVLTRGGVLLDLSDLDFDRGHASGGAHVAIDTAQDSAATGFDGASIDEVSPLGAILRIGNSKASTQRTISLRIGMNSHRDAGGSVSFRPSIASPERVGLDIPEQFKAMIRQLLTGGAGAEQLAQFEQTLERVGQDAKVEDLSGGRYLLTTSPHAGSDQTCGISSVQITYIQGQGVESVELVAGNGATGSVMITFDDAPIAASRLDPAGLVTPQTMTIDSRWIRAWLPASAE